MGQIKGEFTPNYRRWYLLGIQEKDWGHTLKKAFQCGQAWERGSAPGRGDAQGFPIPSSLWAKALRHLVFPRAQVKIDISRGKEKRSLSPLNGFSRVSLRLWWGLVCQRGFLSVLPRPSGLGHPKSLACQGVLLSTIVPFTRGLGIHLVLSSLVGGDPERQGAPQSLNCLGLTGIFQPSVLPLSSGVSNRQSPGWRRWGS